MMLGELSKDFRKKDNDVLPHVILNAAMTLDGKITTKGGDTNLSNEDDWRRVHLLRNSVDAIMVGKNTIVKDDPKLTVKPHLLPPRTSIRHPIRVIISSTLDMPLNAKVFNYKIKEVPTLVVTTTKSSSSKRKMLMEKGIGVLICEKENGQVDLHQSMILLKKRGIRSILLEGGGTLNWQMLKEGLINEITVQIASKISGGGLGAVSFFEGDGFHSLLESPTLLLIDVQKIGNNVVLHYKVEYRKK